MMYNPRQDPKSTIDVSAIIAKDNPEQLVQVAQDVGSEAQVSTSQIRNVFGPVRRLALEWPEAPQTAEECTRAERAYRQVVLLRPKLRYLAARDPSLNKLADLLDRCIVQIQNGKDLAEKRVRFGRFVDFFEAILAYHTEKAKEGKRQ